MSTLPVPLAPASPPMSARGHHTTSGRWLQATGSTADAIRALDWSATSLGPIEQWPATLRTTLNLVLNSAFSMFVGWGDEWLSFYNDAYAPLIGDRPPAIGRPIRDVFPEAFKRVEPLFEKAMRGEATYDECLSMPLLRNGELRDTRWVVSYSPIRNETGEVCGVFVPLHEVTAKVEAEQRLRKNEENLQVISDLVPGLMWRSSGGEKVWTNRRMQEMLEMLDGRDLDEAVHPDDRASLAVERDRAQAEGNRFRHYHRLRSPDGSWRWHVVLSEPLRNGAGEIEEWCGVATDIHDYRTAVEALAGKSALLRSFFSDSADVIWMLDGTTRQFEYLSPAFGAIWGQVAASSGFDWDGWLALIHPDDRDHHALALEQVMGGEVLDEQYRIQHPDGSVRWIRERMFPILGPDGDIQKLGGIAQDISRQSGRIIHLIDGASDSRNRLSQKLQALGYQVRPFAAVDDLARLSRALLPGCVVCVDRNGGACAEQLVAALKGQFGSLPVVLLCAVADASAAIQLMRKGISDIILPTDPPERLEQAIASALAVMQTEASENALVQDAKEQIEPLSEREREILHCLSRGATNKVVARELGISPRTVETHRLRILEKLEVSSLPEAIRIATLAEL